MRRSFAIASGCVLAVAAALRFATLGTQSLWLDEAVTAQLMDRSFGGLFRAIWDGESTPPLFYVLAWLWTHLFGSGEAGLRSLSALCGLATVPVVMAIGRRAGGGRAALLAGALAACNPLLVWFSQEARAYALLVLLGALSILLALRLLERPSAGRAAAWGAVAALALATHYFAVFVIGLEALWLALRLPRARTALALAIPAAAAVALAPLALHQNGNDTAAFIRDQALTTRAGQVGKQWLIGYDAPAETALAIVAALLALAGLAWLAARVRGRVAWLLAALAALAVVVPLVLAIAGEDDFLTRNLLAALVPALCALAAGYAAGRGAGLAAAGALCAIWVVAVVGVASDRTLQRDDWRGAARALGTADAARAVVVTPASGRIPMEHYLGGAEPLGTVAPVAEVDLVGLARRAPGEPPRPPRPADVPPPAPGFAPAGRIERGTFTVWRFRAQAPAPVDPAQLAIRGLDGTPATVLVQP